MIINFNVRPLYQSLLSYLYLLITELFVDDLYSSETELNSDIELKADRNGERGRDEASDQLYDTDNNRIANINNNNNKQNIRSESSENEDTDDEEVDDEEEDETLTTDDVSHEYSGDSINGSQIEVFYNDNFNTDFDDDSDGQSNDTEVFESKKSKMDTNQDSNYLTGRSADGIRRLGLSMASEKVRDIHGNKINIETDPQQPSYDEAIASVVDEMGGIHIQDGPFSLPNKNQIHSFGQLLNYNDKDFGFIEKITADRRPVVRVTRVRKRMRTDFDDSAEIDEKKNEFFGDKNLKSQYVPVLVMDKEDMMTDKEEKIRRHRSDNNFKNTNDEMPSAHFQSQKRQQQQHFALTAAIPVALSEKDFNKSLELRGFMAGRDDGGQMVAFPIFKDMLIGDVSNNNRRKRVRIVQKVVSRQNDTRDAIPVSTDALRTIGSERSQSSTPPKSHLQSQSKALLPRILVPDNHWNPYLPFYGPSMSKIKKIQLLPPIGPIPVPDKPKQELMSVFRPKPKPRMGPYVLDTGDNNKRGPFDVFEKRVAKPVTTSRPSVRINVKPKRAKSKQKSNRNQTTTRAPTTAWKASSRQPIETTTQAFIEVSPDNRRANNGSQQRSQESVRIKLNRNGKRLSPKDNESTLTTPTPRDQPRDQPRDRTTVPKGHNQREQLVLSNVGQPLNGYDYYEIPYIENGTNQTIAYYTASDYSSTTTAAPVEHKKAKSGTNKKKNRPKKGSSAAAWRPAPVYSTPALLSTAAKCTTSKCKLPDCFCGGTATPNNMPAETIPQMVMITFDDSVNDLNWEIYEEVFSDRKNPNGCPILGTFYVSHEWTDYGQVQTLYSQGHEMASHSITHSFGEKFSVSKWNKEVNGQREILHMYGGVALADVRGMRAPFLQGGGNKQFEMLYESNFTYDSTMPVFENSPPFWPYTLDYAINHECMIAPCPTKSFPGVWEVGMVMWHDLKGGRCSMGDACSNPPDEDGVYAMLMKNFNRHYQSNRAPFGLYYHSAWFNTPHHRRGFMRFMDHILTKKDVYFVTKYQMIEWVRHPVSVDQIESFTPWHCNLDDRPPPCKSATVCNVGSKSGSRFLKTCQPCPKAYPWVGNTGFTQNTNT